jgi:hypothetical protein
MESSRTLLKLQNMWKQAFYMILVVFLVVSIHEKDHRLSIFYGRTSNWLFASAQNHNVKCKTVGFYRL